MIGILLVGTMRDAGFSYGSAIGLVAPVLRKALRWRGPIGPALIAYLGGSQAHELASLADPLSWALTVLGFPPGSERPTNKEITRRYRVRMRTVHPDHGGDRATASKEILDLNAARRILSRKEQ